ncbi:mitochondrial complex III assembly protein Cbp6 [Schizosaccharomyces osmophilus]|uniref:Mitochondrial complex III assembly protein Cbp6 n=1 Tax=Schizosaccharomyces osmophilus TaxID=2545709 RepID=A0AAF0AUT2_9SCHI|nr:mitochondrial complex III assembly protein Cbp6 [Schizosaccharomyces osmophilus]WBW71927.1 mitochondrial complex III assembly protein Cbp6 [Schizosaccharomyces osmophilus]
MSNHLTRIISLWPKDELRPWLSFPKALDTTFRSKLEKLSPEDRKLQLNAADKLLENTYWNEFTPQKNVLKPQFNPNYYEDLKQVRRKEVKVPWFKRLFQSN